MVLKDQDLSLTDRIHSYRSGYSPEDRRAIEGKLFRGELLCIIATNALELGIDIGALDAVIHYGFPMSVASYRQQAGRAGRREQDALSILMADGDNMLDQYFVKHPEELHEKNLGSLVLDLANDTILGAHLNCAASEIPINLEEDWKYFGEKELVEDVCEQQLLKDTKFKVYKALF
jgi:DEAD/DEAH box helicase domain-containing protein